MNEKKAPICIYHANCDDGFGSAWVVRKAFGERDVEFFPGFYQEDPPDITDRFVFMVDFSYKRPVIESMLEKCSGMIILDHHATAIDDLAPLVESGKYHPKLAAIFDINRSGCMIAWNHFFLGQNSPQLLLYIQDRDLWKKALQYNDEVIYALRSYPHDFKIWDMLMQKKVSDLIIEGTPIKRYHRKLVDEAKSRARYRLLKGNKGVLVVNVPKYLASEVAGELCEEYNEDFAVCFWYDETGRIEFSLRSRGEFDVGEYAQKYYGGGGHPNAAGFRVGRFEDAIITNG